jgi:hypothetical protein
MSELGLGRVKTALGVSALAAKDAGVLRAFHILMEAYPAFLK